MCTWTLVQNLGDIDRNEMEDAKIRGSYTFCKFIQPEISERSKNFTVFSSPSNNVKALAFKMKKKLVKNSSSNYHLSKVTLQAR